MVYKSKKSAFEAGLPDLATLLISDYHKSLNLETRLVKYSVTNLGIAGFDFF
jgi:hypothetical protein